MDRLKALPTDLKQRVLIWVIIFSVCIGARVYDLVDGGYGWAPEPVQPLFLVVLGLQVVVVLLVLALQRAAVALGVLAVLGEAALNFGFALDDASPVDYPTLGLPVVGLFVVFILFTAPRTWALLRPRAAVPVP